MKRHIIILALALLTMQAYAQHDEQVTVEGRYRPKANKVSKLQLQPETPQPSYAYPSSEVNPMEANQKFALDLEKIAPTGYAAKNDNLVNPTQNFLMAGIGTRLSPLFLYKHNSMLTKTLGLGVGIKHNSSWLNMKRYAPSSYMNNAFDIGLSTSKLDGFQIDGNVFYKNSMYHYYGVNLDSIPLTDEEMEETCPRQIYNTIGGHFGLASTSTRKTGFSHKAGLDYHYTFDKIDSKEHFAGVDYAIAYAENWWGDKNYPQKVGLDLGFQYDYFMGRSETTNVYDRFWFKVNPFFEMSGKFYRVHLGARLDGSTRMREGDKVLGVRPDISGSLFVLNNKLEFYAGLNGGRSLLTYSAMTEENPFLGVAYRLPYYGDGLRLCVKDVKLGFNAGVRTNITEVVDLHLGVRYSQTKDDPFFVLVPEYVGSYQIANKFDLIYDDTQLLSVLADVRLKLRMGLTTDLGFAYNGCKPAVEEHAWYRPMLEGKLKLAYNLNDNLAFNASFLYQGGRYAKVFKENAVWGSEKLKDVFDLSFGADYKVNEQITAFALIDNLACQKYQLYYNYPVTGIQFFAGVKLRF